VEFFLSRLSIPVDKSSKTQLMVLGKQALKEAKETGVFNQLDAYRFKVAQRAGNMSILCGT
jgi:hypothetical protein